MRKIVLAFICMVVVTGCVGTNSADGDEKNKNDQVTPKTTKLTYTINLEPDESGNYQGKVGDPVVIEASAEGPKAREARWAILRQSVSSGSITDSSLLNTGGGMDIGQKKTYNFKNPVTIEIKCGPAENFIVNGVPTFEGQKTFKIVITK